MNKRVIPSHAKRTYERAHYAPAVWDGETLRCSGSLGIDPKTHKVPDDPKAQFAHAFQGIELVLKEAGLQLSDITEMTSFHVDMSKHMGVFAAVKDDFLKEPYPAWSAIGVSELAMGALVEIRVNARKQ
jgi:enamine deaminase RidA (YjgF/YER057c/UK114 family)